MLFTWTWLRCKDIKAQSEKKKEKGLNNVAMMDTVLGRLKTVPAKVTQLSLSPQPFVMSCHI